jgi:hypothetical protein
MDKKNLKTKGLMAKRINVFEMSSISGRTSSFHSCIHVMKTKCEMPILLPQVLSPAASTEENSPF